MITVTFLHRAGQLTGFELNGHSDYDEIGKDIVCSAVSSAAYLTVNTITDVICAKCGCLKTDNGYMKLIVSEKYVDACQDVLNGFKLHIKQLSKDYSKFIKIIGGNTDA